MRLAHLEKRERERERFLVVAYVVLCLYILFLLFVSRDVKYKTLGS